MSERARISTPTVPPPGRGRVAAVTVLALVLLLALLAVVLAGVSFASYTSVKERLDSFASDGDADVTRADFDAIVTRLRVAALVAALLAAGAFVARRRLAALLGELGASVAAACSALVRGLSAAIAAESRLHLAALGAVTAVGLLVRLEFLFQPMRYDEAGTYVHYASQPWYIGLTTYTAPNNHVLHTFLVHLSTTVFGGAPWAIRMPAFVAGVLLVPATYVAGRALYGRHAGLIAAGLVAASSVLIEYSTNARGYTLVALLFVLMLALGTRLRGSASLAEWLALALLAALALFTVPSALYAVGGIALWLGLELRRERTLLLRRWLPAVLVASMLTLLLYAPVVAASGLDSLLHNEFVEPLSFAAFVDELPDSLWSVVEGWHRDIPWPLAVVLAAAFVTGLVAHRRLSAVSVPPALALLAFVAPVVVLQRVVPIERVWLFALPLDLATAAAGLALWLRPVAARVGGERVVAIVVAVVAAAALAGGAVASQAVYDSEDTSTFRDGSAVADLLEAELRPGDKVVVAPPADGILEYHLLRRELDPAALLYWEEPGDTSRFLVVVGERPDDYALDEVLADPRLEGVRLGSPRVVRRYDAATVYAVDRAG